MNIYSLTWMQLQILVSWANKRTGRLVGDRGEGVISTAIAVLIVAFLGAAMWVGFNTIWDGAETTIKKEVNSIGNGK
ncbi:MAG: hypothetical protein OXB92_11955 [Acidimicrobiaceae bacterium]|nr:hypothetical protein [Acidimicrobiia bacterium]MCY4494559.1 hypothetical protein [Acidimicrobiaceae bacterium]